MRRLKPSMKGPPILCFVGASGVGKTSWVSHHAFADKFAALVDLGGVHDEAEIRGRRPHFLPGALPGPVRAGRKPTRAGAFMLDEIDEVGRDFPGDPGAAALLEPRWIPEQNFHFSATTTSTCTRTSSKVLFITTANQLDPIPEPLRNRMEIQPNCRATPRKRRCTSPLRYLIPRRNRRGHAGPRQSKSSFPEETVGFVIQHYTREAGVRNLNAPSAPSAEAGARYKPKDTPTSCW